MEHIFEELTQYDLEIIKNQEYVPHSYYSKYIFESNINYIKYIKSDDTIQYFKYDKQYEHYSRNDEDDTIYYKINKIHFKLQKRVENIFFLETK